MKIAKVVKIPKLAQDEFYETSSFEINEELSKLDLEIKKWFGDDFVNYSKRYISYNFIKQYIADEYVDWNYAPNTSLISEKFARTLKEMNDYQFAFLLCHNGYIPEVYKPDSSQETLYSKLVEVVVSEWAFRIGFTSSSLPTQKSSKEDITISDGENIIVADAKSYRLGRSQAAPNVKDALKKGDIIKWLAHYDPSKYNRVGGLVAFPSQHDWKNGSDFYLYLTDKNSPIIMLFYEHMAFMLLSGMNKNALLNFFNNHHEIFPEEELNKIGSRAVYFDKLCLNLLNTGGMKWSDFLSVANYISSEKATATLSELENLLAEEKVKSMDWANSLTADDAKKQLADIKYQLDNQNLIRQKNNILSFRKLVK